jgi:hypothetical protein
MVTDTASKVRWQLVWRSIIGGRSLSMGCLLMVVEGEGYCAAQLMSALEVEQLGQVGGSDGAVTRKGTRRGP